MGKRNGFLELTRQSAQTIDPLERIMNFQEFHIPLSKKEQVKQASRCMDCGIPFCQYGQEIKGMVSGCPLNNLIPEWNDCIYQGHYDEALKRLLKTNNFPEFTSITVSASVGCITRYPPCLSQTRSFIALSLIVCRLYKLESDSLSFS